MDPTLRDLLADRSLALRLRTGDDGMLDEPISWMASSDLADPTPFLDEGNALLTTGATLASDAEIRAYAARLSARGIRAVGFGTDVLRPLPPALVDACAAEGLPLFEVPFDVPFLAVIRAVADRIAQAAHARDAWALAAQRSVAQAALRPDGLASGLAELSRQLDGGVWLFDARCRPIHSPGPAPAQPVVDAAARLLRAGRRASATVDPDVTLQTVGRSGELRGVLAVGARWDAATRAVVTGVLALAGLSLEQERALGRSRAGIRSGVFSALVTGQQGIALDVARHLGTPLPPAPVRVVAFPSVPGDALVEDVVARAGEEGVFPVEDADGLLAVAGSAEAAAFAVSVSEAHGIPSGVSSPTGYDGIAAALRQARRALEAAPAGGTVRYDDIASDGLERMLDAEAVRDLATAVLGPVSAAPNGEALLEAAEAWLEHNGQWDRAAAALGIHRNTLRARIARVERLTGRGLSTFEARTGLWLALRARRRG